MLHCALIGGFEACHTEENFRGNVKCVCMMLNLYESDIPDFIPVEQRHRSYFSLE
jgi:hypothetical protein